MVRIIYAKGKKFMLAKKMVYSLNNLQIFAPHINKTKLYYFHHLALQIFISLKINTMKIINRTKNTLQKAGRQF